MDVTEEQAALRAFWTRHADRLAPVSRALYDELDRLIRADERRQVAGDGSAAGLIVRYNDAVKELTALRRDLAARHVLGGCPMCRDSTPTEVRMTGYAWGMVAFGLVLGLGLAWSR